MGIPDTEPPVIKTEPPVTTEPPVAKQRCDCVGNLLSDELQQQIKEIYNPSNPDEVRIQHCFGIYNGSAALWITRATGYSHNVWSEMVAGYEFVYGSGQRMWILNNNGYLPLTRTYTSKDDGTPIDFGAFEGGWITEEDVAEIHHNYVYCKMYGGRFDY
ncbi:MAG: hypothetical protein FWF94_03845 [Oscillospiraceae bacterium]|nr:hypothetical protein [Oscillospiraceae bacterium]